MQKTDHMQYLDGMEIIQSDIMEKILAEISLCEFDKYTTSDVENAINSERCSLEDFKALLSPAAKPLLEKIAERAQSETRKYFGNSIYLFHPFVYFKLL